MRKLGQSWQCLQCTFLLPSLSYFSDFQMFTEAAFLIPESARKMSKSRSLQFEKAYPKCMVWSFSVTTFSPLLMHCLTLTVSETFFFQETEETKEFFPQKVNESQKTWLVALKYFPFNTIHIWVLHWRFMAIFYIATYSCMKNEFLCWNGHKKGQRCCTLILHHANSKILYGFLHESESNFKIMKMHYY